MTVIAVRDGVMAADSRMTISTESGGERMFPCEKLYRKFFKRGRRTYEAIIGCAGDVFAGPVFVEWYGSGKPPPQSLIDADADLTAIVLTTEGLHEYDLYCVPERRPDTYAIGSGTLAALGAMDMGASARRAVEAACRYSPGCGLPVVTMRLKRAKK